MFKVGSEPKLVVRPGRQVRRTAARRHSFVARRNIVWGWIFLTPAGVLFLLLVAWPTVGSLWQSLYKTPSFGPAQFAWFTNYERMFRDPLFWNSLRVTGLWTVGTVPIVATLGLLVAAAISQRWLRGSGIWRLIFFLPVMTSTVAIAFTWKWMFDPRIGLVNQFLQWLGLHHAPAWLASPRWALPAIMIVGIWQQTGYAMVLYLAGLQAIPAEYYEAAAIDGAGTLKQTRFITLPLLNPTILLVTVILVINAFREFNLPFVMSATPPNPAGGPLNSTDTFVVRLYDIAWHQFDFGYAAANAVALLAITAAVASVQFKLTQRKID